MNDIAMMGLGVMGQNLALNMESKGYCVAAFDIDKSKCDAYKEKTKGKNIEVFYSARDMINSLKKPSKVMLMVPAGKYVDSAAISIIDYLDKDDIIIDGGNSNFKDTQRRCEYFKEKGIKFIGCGVSGGEEGALKGPAMMPGGEREAFDKVKHIFFDICAKYGQVPCCDYMGEDGAGHFVKMVHNGIEYSDMEIICEAYLIMKRAGFSYDKMSEVFGKWNTGELKSYLIEITSNILKMKDPITGKPYPEVVLDTAGQKGTGKWTATNALDLGVPAPTIAEAVFARCLSAIKDERGVASEVFETKESGPAEEDLLLHLEKALYCAKVISYAQGFMILKEAKKEYNWSLDFSKIANVWRAGCIIRADFLNDISKVYRDCEDINLLISPLFKDKIENYSKDLRYICSECIKREIPAPNFMSALSFFDGYKSLVLPANLLQCQRDYFGAHGFKRVDKLGDFHLEY